MIPLAGTIETVSFLRIAPSQFVNHSNEFRACFLAREKPSLEKASQESCKLSFED
jgi:hypothetical protein